MVLTDKCISARHTNPSVMCQGNIGVIACVQVSLPEVEVKAGLALEPQALDVSLVDRPLTDLLFTQFMASVSGKVYCLGKS